MLGHTDMASRPEDVAACTRQAEGLTFETLISSDLQRCRNAADAVGSAHGVEVMVDPRWRELNFGQWDGLPASAIDADALGRFWDDPDAHAPPGGESWSMLLDRVGQALAALAPRPTLVVTHAGVMRAALHLLCGIARPHLWAFDLSYGAILSLHVWPGPTPTAQIRTLR